MRGFRILAEAVTEVDSILPAAENAVKAAPAAAEVSAVGTGYLLVVFVLLFLLFEKGKKKYTPFCNALEKKEYPLRSLTVIGFALMELIRYPYKSSLDRKLRKELRELREEEYVEFYLHVTWATAATCFLIALFFSGLLAFANLEPAVVAAAAGFGVLLGYAVIADVDKKVAEHHKSIVMDLPDFANKLLILSGAGMSLKAAMVKIAKEMDKRTPFYQALKHSVYLMENGATAEQVMDSLGNRCNLPEVRRMNAVLLQNMHSGGADALLALREISKELWTNRRATAKKLAEEAGTKLLFPMMLMLLAVILIVAAPAVMSLSLT